MPVLEIETTETPSSRGHRAMDALHILVIEESQEQFVAIRNALAHALGSDVGVDRAGSVGVANVLLSGNRYHLALVDGRIGARHALGLLRELRRAAANLPIVFLTGAADEASAAAALHHGAADAVAGDPADFLALRCALFASVSFANADQALREAEAGLRASEERYRLLFERNPAAVFRATPDGRLLDCNEAFARLFGYPSRGAALAHGRLDQHGDAAERAHLLEQLQRDGVVANLESCIRRLDGSVAWVLENIGLIHDHAGEVVFEGTLVDITERRQLEEQVRQAEKMDAIVRLAADIAHEFNNVIMVISGYAELLADGVSDNPRLLRNADEMLKAARRATGLTQQLLAFGSKQLVAPRPIELDAAVRCMIGLMQRLVGDNIVITVADAPPGGTIIADPGQIEHMLMHLAANARSSMPAGGRLSFQFDHQTFSEAQPRPCTLPPGDYVSLTVTDTGVGLDAEAQAHIFEPTFAVKAGNDAPMSLASVYGIVRQTGGCVTLSSSPGEGTAVRIYLPRVAAEPVPAAVAANPPTRPGAVRTLLIVEDEEAVLDATRQFLELRGYVVLQARNGAAAIEIAERSRTPIDLLLTDIVMPGIGGRAVAEALRALRPGVCVLYMSGYPNSELVTSTGGAADFLQKPFSLAALEQKVRALLERSP